MSHSSSRPTSASGFVLLTASCAVLGAAFLVWDARSETQQTPDAQTGNATSRGVAPVNSSTRNAADTARDAQIAMKLLNRSYQADNSLTYDAQVSTTAMYGAQKMETRARLLRAPHQLSVTYLSGERCGLQGGYSQNWFWRRDGKSAPLQAYASVAYKPAEMAAQRFELLTENYHGVVLRTEKIAGRLCDVVELRRVKPLENTKGPFKRLWLDRETALTLRTDAFNYRGDLVQRSQMTQLKLHKNIADENFVAPAMMKAVAKKDDWNTEETGTDFGKVATMTGLRPPKPTWLPAGFAFDSVGMQRTSLAKGAPLASLSRYGDGLNVITIFVFKSAKSAKPDAAEISCTFGAGTMAMQQKPNGLSVIAIADLPTPVLQKILNTVSLS